MPASVPHKLPFPFPVVTWRDDAVVLLDQTVLPGAIAWCECRDIPTLCKGIKDLAVRGAPAIGVAAAYGLALAWRLAIQEAGDAPGRMSAFERYRTELAATRPTAVNLFWALDRCAAVAQNLAAAGADPDRIAAALLKEADAVKEEDLDMCRTLGRHGAELLPDEATVLTHCNAGGLATSGYGTAVGVIFAAVEAGKKIHVYADETRPLCQGTRLTAFECVNQDIPVTVLSDSAAASALRQGRIDAVITGADRVVANGDAANKIGTYPLAVLAHRHDVPFYIAAPASTFDAATPTGDGIVIEERDPAEVLTCMGYPVAAPGAEAWNPAFDVTPAELITAFITEQGVLYPPYGESLNAVL